MAVASAPLVLAACSASSYAGIPLAPGAASSDLQQLAILARAGDKQAQLDLGIRYEEGIGVPRNLDRAARLYARAAAASGGPVLVYAPPVAPQKHGRLVRVENGPRIQGLAAAKERLDKLRRGSGR